MSYRRFGTLLAFGYYTIEDMDGTLNAYEQVLAAGRQGVIMESLETNALRALFQLYYQREEYRKSLNYMDQWEALTGRKDAQITYLRATAHYQLEEFRDSLKWAIETENLYQGRRQGSEGKLDLFTGCLVQRASGYR